MSDIAELLGHVRRGDRQAVERLLTAQPSLANARDDGGNSPLLVAIYTGRSDVLPVLLERGARPSFFEVCAAGLTAEVRRQLGADPGAARQWAHDGWTPLHLAAFFGHREVAEALLEAAADVRALSRNAEANLPINAAAAGPRAERRPDVVRLLIDRGSPVDGRGSPTAHTPLHEAAYNGDVALVRLLLERGADPSLRTGEGQTPLEIATQQGRHEIVGMLAAVASPSAAQMARCKPPST
jgi:ankyrin repeat protein